MGRARKLIRRFRKDRLFHDRVRLRVGTAFNLSYALVKFALAGQEGSIWMASVALYYTAVTFVLLYLVRADLRLGAADAPGANQAHWRVAGHAGWMLGSLVLTLSGMGVLVVRDGAAPAYPGHLIFGMAAFAFYSVGMAIARFVRGRHGLGPLFTAAKCVDLSVATVSLYALQTALIGRYAPFWGFGRTLNLITGAGAAVLVAGIAVWLVGAASNHAQDAEGKD